MKPYCKERVGDGRRDWNCTRRAVKGGYCRVHHPSAVAARAQESLDRWNREFQEKELRAKIREQRAILAWVRLHAPSAVPLAEEHLRRADKAMQRHRRRGNQ